MLNLVHETHPILYNRVADFDFDNPPVDPKELVRDLTATMLMSGGIGISANQCGLPYRVFVMLNSGGVPFEAFNPVITEETGTAINPEGCLSFPGLSLKVKRPMVVTLSGQDSEGKPFVKVLAGTPAVCAHHETDHLNGIAFTQRVSRLKLDMALKKLRR